MTVQQDVKRAGLRAMMAESMLGVPEYSADPNGTQPRRVT
jgi:hypothetical protein